MFSNQEAKIIARLIVGAASIDGTLNTKERELLSSSLIEQGFSTIVAEIGTALDDDFSTFDIFLESRTLLENLGSKSSELTPKIFKIIATSISGDRFISEQEASFLSALSRRLKLSTAQAGKIIKEILEKNKGKLEISGDQVDALIHPHLKELLSFTGSSNLVGEINSDSLEERIYQAKKELEENSSFSKEEIDKALLSLGLNSSSTIEDAKEIWQDTLSSINLSKLIHQGVIFVSSAIEKAKIINDAYELLVKVDKSLHTSKSKNNEIEILEEKRIREEQYQVKSLEPELKEAFNK
jgi:hypothetical protein